tara:strand:- start:1491 stop:1775 length:285 start_codon:yes stop_codon:yes gene_type:complete
MRTLAALASLLIASTAIGATYNPAYKPEKKYSRERPRTDEERRIWREERAVLRVNGLRFKPDDCEFSKAYLFLPYDRYNIRLICDQPLHIYSLD